MIRVHIRWLVQMDMRAVLRMESSLDEPWTEEDILRWLRHRNNIGMVAEHGERVVGYMLYELHERRIDLVRLVVCPRHRMMSVGVQMLDKLQSKLSAHRRSHLVADVPEGNLGVQKWLRACGWRAITVIRGDEDLYRFVWHVNGHATPLLREAGDECRGR